MPKKTPAQLNREIVDALLDRMKQLEAERNRVADDLREAARAADRVDIAEERGQSVDPAKRQAARDAFTSANRRERELTKQLIDLVHQIRALDPNHVPWAWRNTP